MTAYGEATDWQEERKEDQCEMVPNMKTGEGETKWEGEVIKLIMGVPLVG